MSGQCGQCPALHAEIARQRQIIHQLERRIANLREWVAFLLAGLRGAVALIAREDVEPTMPRRNLVPAIHQHLTDLIERAEGNQR
ncbi:hypothetical protein ACFPIJ_55200 [Dactylosporangium cerinum]|uniref:Uncharacterized protein n=1 Tax=Dactylosporangium cerinum TaxID=1434730 RepID=A0ABV9WHE6_9ACTN